MHDDLGVGEVAELAQLDGGELDLLRAAADQHVHVADPRWPAGRRARRPGRPWLTSSSAVRASTRATSSATLPAPTTATPGVSSRGAVPWSGCPQYQPTIAPEPMLPGQVLTRDAEAPVERRSRWRARPRCSARAAPASGMAAVADLHAAEEADLARAERPGRAPG